MQPAVEETDKQKKTHTPRIPFGKSAEACPSRGHHQAQPIIESAALIYCQPGGPLRR